jgi:hypothetical protein
LASEREQAKKKKRREEKRERRAACVLSPRYGTVKYSAIPYTTLP